MESLQIEKQGRLFIVTLQGELTLEIVEEVKAKIEEIFADDWEILVVNLTDINFLDSSGIGFLVATNNRAKQSGKKFYLLAPSKQVVKTLKLVNLLHFFDILDSEDELITIMPS
ncbi:STAS domain-containing protein [Desulfovulcanus sp.]